jgi:hypothetical protein
MEEALRENGGKRRAFTSQPFFDLVDELDL